MTCITPYHYNLELYEGRMGAGSHYTVHQGKWYRATLTLGLFEQIVDNDTIARRLEDVGFTQVSVTGSGRTRSAIGFWPHADATAEIPTQVSAILPSDTKPAVVAV